MTPRIRIEDLQASQQLRSIKQMTLRKGAERLLASAQQIVIEVTP